jgi:hypothetical protein
MSTIERKNGVVYFEFQKQMITKRAKGWYTAKGEKVDGRKLRGFLKRGTIQDRGEVMQLRSILNRFFGGEYILRVNQK